LWLARRALEAKDVPAALALYREALSHLQPATAEALVQISEDLGKNGLLKELTEMCAPAFDVKRHGLPVGNNLIKAYVGLRDASNAKKILGQLSSLEWPEWREHLQYWEREIDGLAEENRAIAERARVEVQFLALNGPIWAPAGTPFAEMLTAKSDDAPRVAFFCGTFELPSTDMDDKAGAHRAKELERFARGLPLYLAERVHLKTSAKAMTLVPRTKNGDFAPASTPWSLEDLAKLAQKPDYVVFLHLIAREDSWQAKLEFLRVSDQKALAAWEQPIDPMNTAAAVQAMAKRALIEIPFGAKASREATLEGLFPPTLPMLANYISGLAQALEAFCAALPPDAPPLSAAERTPLDRLLDLCLRETDNATMRLLLLSTAEREARVQPGITKEYREPLERLQREHPLRRPARGLTDAALARICAV
jgi:hypothetical protein